MGRLHSLASGEGPEALAEPVDEEIERLCKILEALRKQIIRRAVVAWDRSPETFGEELVALNDIDQAIRNNCSSGR